MTQVEATSTDERSDTTPSFMACEALRRGTLDDMVKLGEFARITECPVWRLSEMYWAQTGSEAFTGGDVPYVATNDGPHAGDAVDVFIESVRASERDGELENELIVLELGAGSGLFAKLFLDQLKARCRCEGLGYYGRTRYIVSDGSASMLEDLVQTGVLADHHHLVERLQLPLPGIKMGLEAATDHDERLFGSVRAIHANYLLDSLPFTILCLEGDCVWELQMRGRIAEADLKRLGLSLESGVLDLEAIGSDPELMEMLQGALVLETRYMPTNRTDLPVGACVPHGKPDGSPAQYLHSFGAIECLDEAARLLRPGGYILATDYGYTDRAERPKFFEPQNFGRSVACGVNFEQIETHFGAVPALEVQVPASDPESLETRLIGRDVAPGVAVLFRDRYTQETWQQRNGPATEAAKFIEEGRFEAARFEYLKLLRLQPWSWSSHEIVAAFLVHSLAEPEAAIPVVRRGLELNHLSAGLINLLGDCHYDQGDYDIAEEVYRHALEVSPQDVRARMNLAYVHVHQGRHAAALRMIGEALSLDRTADFRPALLEKQAEAIDGLVQGAARDVLRGVNRMRGGYYELPDRSTTNIT